jgi:GGDEF domain-containing protein
LIQNDLVTGLLDRRSFLKTVEIKVATFDDIVGVLILDIGHFSMSSHALGMPASDILLCSLSDQIVSAIGGRGCRWRHGDGSFAVFAFDAGDIAGIVETLQDFCSRPFIINGQAITLSCHIGVASTEPSI